MAARVAVVRTEKSNTCTQKREICRADVHKKLSDLPTSAAPLETAWLSSPSRFCDPAHWPCCARDSAARVLGSSQRLRQAP